MRLGVSNNERQCAICINNFKVGDKICYSRNKQCSHCFHYGCISEWLMKNNECPLCREDFIGVSEDDANARVIGDAEVVKIPYGSIA